MLKKFISTIKNNKRKIALALSVLFLAGAVLAWFFFKKENYEGDLVFAVASDIHASAKNNPSINTVKTKKYSETLPRFVSEVERINPAFTIELGDFINGTERNTEQGTKDFNLVNEIYSRIPERHYVLGNHDVIALTKEEFRRLSAMPANHYSFLKNGYRFIILDAQYNTEGKDMGPGIKKNIPGFIPENEKNWLKEEIKNSAEPVVIFSHQPLFSADPSDEKLTFLANADEIKAILSENKEKVLGFFSGHNHRPAVREEEGIKYFFIPSMAYVETMGAYAIVEIEGKNLQVHFLNI